MAQTVEQLLIEIGVSGADEVDQAGKKITAALKKVPKPANAANRAMVDVGRVMQDAAHGPAAVASNLEPMMMSFRALKATSSGTLGALRALGSAFLGPAGIVIAVTSLLPLLPKLVSKMRSLTGAADDVKGAFKNMFDLPDVKKFKVTLADIRTLRIETANQVRLIEEKGFRAFAHMGLIRRRHAEMEHDLNKEMLSQLTEMEAAVKLNERATRRLEEAGLSVGDAFKNVAKHIDRIQLKMKPILYRDWMTTTNRLGKKQTLGQGANERGFLEGPLLRKPPPAPDLPEIVSQFTAFEVNLLQALEQSIPNALSVLSGGIGEVVSNILTLEDGFKSVADAAKAFGDVFKVALREIISQLVTVIAKMAILKGAALIFGFTSGSPGLAGNIVRAVGAGLAGNVAPKSSQLALGAQVIPSGDILISAELAASRRRRELGF